MTWYNHLTDEGGDTLTTEDGEPIILGSITGPPAIPTRPRWRIDLCVGWERVAAVTAYEFRAKVNRNAPGEWELEASPEGVTPSGYTADPDDAFDPRDVDTIRLVIGRRILVAGVVAGDNGGFFAERDADGERWRWAGVDLWGHEALDARLAFPDPAVANPADWSVDDDERTGTASTVLAGYLNNNAGSSALAERQVSGFEVTDEQVGGSFTCDFSRLQTLAALAQRIGNMAGFEVIPTVDFDGTVNVLLSSARDVSSVVVLSDQGDLLSSQARFQRRSASWVLSAGSGEGTARTFAVANTTATTRRERLRDVSAITSAAEVAADAAAQLTLAGEQNAVTTELTDSITDLAITAGLRVGDRVGVIIRGRKYSLPIEAMSFEVTPERQVMRPQLGAGVPDEFTGLLRDVSGLADRFNSDIS